MDAKYRDASSAKRLKRPETFHLDYRGGFAVGIASWSETPGSDGEVHLVEHRFKDFAALADEVIAGDLREVWGAAG